MLEKFNKFLNSSIVLSILMFVLGLIFMIYPTVSFSVVTYIIAIFLILNGIYFIIEKDSSLLLSDAGYKNWLVLFICSLLGIICGIYIIVNPTVGSDVITTYVGIVIMVYAISNIIDTIVFKKNVNDIVKLLK